MIEGEAVPKLASGPRTTEEHEHLPRWLSATAAILQTELAAVRRTLLIRLHRKTYTVIVFDIQDAGPTGGARYGHGSYSLCCKSIFRLTWRRGKAGYGSSSKLAAG
jgi:hypothetical protein